MNKNSTENSKSISPHMVISKYFSSCPVMDESLTDFQEKKSKAAGPKTSQKTVNKKAKAQRTKRIKGQKDIWTALKSKKNDLLTYAKQFDKVCKLSGVDVDSEQLQLAIALTKSVQPKTDDCISQNCVSTTSQERTARICTTLQEYGFTVPEIKITNKRKLPKIKKDYKLLLTTVAEKQQRICDKYTQVLCQNISKFTENDIQLDTLDRRLYHLATNIEYEGLKNNVLLYVNGLIEKSTSTGNLLRDWSEIPGRAKSPLHWEPYTMSVSEIACSQEELDIILSGTLNHAKNVVKKKVQTQSDIPSALVEQVVVNEPNITSCIAQSDIIVVEEENKPMHVQDEPNYSNSSPISPKSSSSSHQAMRSCSPDIFDDEQSGFLENSKVTNEEIYQEMIDSITEDESLKNDDSDVIIDLTQNTTSITEGTKQNFKLQIQMSLKRNQLNSTSTIKDKNCSIISPRNNITQNLQITDVSKYANNTQRISNDMMEITGCIGTQSRRISAVANSDLRESPPLPSESISINDHITSKVKATQRISNDMMEMTECVAEHQITNIEAQVDLTQNSDECDEKVVSGIENTMNNVDESYASNSSDDLPSVQISGTNKSKDDTIILHNKEIRVNHKSAIGANLKHCESYMGDNLAAENYDLTQSTLRPEKEENIYTPNKSFYDEFVHNHSDDVTQETFDESLQSEPKTSDENAEVDLTQTSNSSDETSVCNTKVTCTVFDTLDRNLGKKHDVSIDYDDLYYNIAESNSKVTEFQQSAMSSDVDNINYSTTELSRQRQSNVHKILTKISLIGCSSPTNNKSLVASEKKHPLCTTPCKEFNKEKVALLQTPSNNDYIIKTDQVTPMLDYASMSTPERNKELDKYGLKPFKRKRAIQLLTYLYNQTHPVVEQTEELGSPAKKRKRSQPSPKEPLKSPIKESELSTVCNKENEIYEVSDECPQIRDVQCLEEDWVFQKREKAKVHSCRMPLHIAFHNYVSCRRGLREAILQYKPVNIDVIHRGLVTSGHRYDPKDLLKYMDKKCITVKTVDNDARNKRS